LHCQFGKRLIARENVTPTYLEKAQKLTESHSSGQSIRKYALKAVKEAKKMLYILEESADGYIFKNCGKDDFCSGKTIDDIMNSVI
jgi:hypothetical protein